MNGVLKEPWTGGPWRGGPSVRLTCERDKGGAHAKVRYSRLWAVSTVSEDYDRGSGLRARAKLRRLTADEVLGLAW